MKPEIVERRALLPERLWEVCPPLHASRTTPERRT
jgi:hypothetical protein